MHGTVVPSVPLARAVRELLIRERAQTIRGASRDTLLRVAAQLPVRRGSIALAEQVVRAEREHAASTT